MSPQKDVCDYEYVEQYQEYDVRYHGVLFHSLCERMGTVQEHVVLVNRPERIKVYFFLTPTQQFRPSRPSCVAPVDPVCHMLRDMPTIIAREMGANRSHLLVTAMTPHHAPLLVPPGGPPFIFYIA